MDCVINVAVAIDNGFGISGHMEIEDTSNSMHYDCLSLERCCCDLCGNDVDTILFHARDWRYGIDGEYPVVECGNCGLVFVNPRPTRVKIGEHYPEEYAPYGNDAADKTNSLSAYLRQRIFGKTRSEESPWATMFNSVEYRAFLSAPKSDSKMLDVGCGAGAYLSVWRNLGWKTEGVEFNEAVAKRTRKRLGIKVHVGSAETVQLPADEFDLVTMSHVLEHTFSPTQALLNIRGSLVRKGKLLLMVPNFESIDRMLFNENWAALDVPRHLYHFSPSTLSALLSKTGFSTTKIGFSAYPTDLLRSIRKKLHLNHRAEPALYEKICGLALSIVPTLFGRGSSIWCVAEKG
jgi:2-polyprenyl-3-methyl-5-hydroxy-6-metoxy-1,4-benzoquinol methylase